MFRYRNAQTGRVIERPTADEWLEASSGWELLDEEPVAPTPSSDKEEEGSK